MEYTVLNNTFFSILQLSVRLLFTDRIVFMKNDMYHPNVIKANIFYLTEYTTVTRVTHYRDSLKLNLWTATLINYFSDLHSPSLLIQCHFKPVRLVGCGTVS